MRLPRIQVSRFSRVPPALFVVAVPLFLVTGAVTWAFNSPGLYHGGFERYDVSRVTGITDEDLRQVAKDIRGYFNSRQEPLDVGPGSLAWNAHCSSPKKWSTCGT